MILTDKIWLGVAAGAAGVGYFGNQDEDLGDRLASGAMLGAVAGLGAGTLMRASKSGLGAGKWAGSKYLSSMSSRYAGLRKSGGSVLQSSFHAYGTRGVFTGLGAVIGASVAGEGHRTQGAAIGAATGFAARTLIGGASVYKQFGRIRGGKTAFIGGLSALAFAAGSSFSSRDHVEAGVYNPAAPGGFDTFDPGSAPDSGIQDRIKNIGASGSVVLGSHGRRHG